MEQQLNELLDQLKAAREHAAGLRDERKQMIEEVQATPAFRALSEAGAEADETVTELESTIHYHTLNLYEEDAALPDRVGIRNKPVVHIPDELLAKTWAISNYTAGLKLDVKAIEDEAKKGRVPAEIATVTTVATATIATKL